MKVGSIMSLKSRNSSFKKIAAKNLLPDPLNWHTHGAEQRAALTSVFKEIGFVGTILVRQSDQRGKYWIIDGHERVESIKSEYGPEQQIDCAVLDVTEEEARKILASHDSIGAMGGVDQTQLESLLSSIQFDNNELDSIIKNALDFRISDEIPVPDQPTESAPSSRTRKSSGPGAGFREIKFPLSAGQEMQLRKIIAFAKKKFGIETTGEAVLKVCLEWMENEKKKS